MADLGSAIATAGQYLGLPEFGISEKINKTPTQTVPSYTGQGVLGSGGYIHNPTTTPSSMSPVSGGVYTSGAYKGQSASFPTGTSNTNSNPAVQGASTQQSSSGPGYATPGSQDDVNAPQFAQWRAARDAQAQADQQRMMAEIDGVYNPQNDYLNQAEGNLRNDYPNILAEVDSQFNTNKSLLDTNKKQSLSQSQATLGQAQGRKEDALSAARRLYQELGQARTARFGGASSAGEAASEIQGRELQNQFGQTNKQFNDFSQQVAQKNSEIEDNYNNGLMQLQTTMQSAKNQAQRDFQDKLLQIANNRTQIASAKAQMRLQALQDLRNQTFAIDQQNMQFQQQLTAMKEQAKLQVQSYNQTQGQTMNGLNTAYNQYASNTTTNPTTNAGIGATSQSTSNPALVGQINQKRPEDQYIGQIAPTRSAYDSLLPLNGLFN